MNSKIKIKEIPVKIFNKLKHIYICRLGPFVRKLRMPPLPKNINGEILVHIGCGEERVKRFINIDARALPHVHYVTEDLTLKQFPSSSINLIYACHVLEHISHQKLSAVVSDWYNHLKPQGILRLSVPDFDQIIAIYKDQRYSIVAIQPALMGGQEYAFNYHYAVFNHDNLRDILLKGGFSAVRTWDPSTAPYYSFDDWAGRKLKIDNKEYTISLNLEAIK